MILQNLNRIAEYPIRQSSYLVHDVSTAWGMRGDTSKNMWVGDADISSMYGVYKGYTFPYTWLAPMKGGGLASRITAAADVEDANLAKGLGASATITGEGSVDYAALQSIVSLLATVAGVGDVSDANLAGMVELAASVLGEGNVHDANLGSIINMLATASGVGSVDATLTGLSMLAAHIYVNEGAADANTIRDAILNAVAADFDESGTIGEKINAAGTAGDPWTTELPGSYSGEQAGAIIGKKILTTGKFIALK